MSTHTGPSRAASNGAETSPPAAEPSNSSSITRKDFRIITRKLPILKAGPIDAMTSQLGIAPPEMIFGDNLVSIEHIPSGWSIRFNAFDALNRVDKTGNSMLKVSYSQEWQKSRENTHQSIEEVVKPFDWSYSTDYKGTTAIPDAFPFEPSSNPLPTELLKRPDPILFYDEVMLYEDELADNGISMLSCKIRVMPSCLLLLARFFLRLDNVLLRLRDTRIFVNFDTGEVIREYISQEDEYNEVRKTFTTSRKDIPATMRDSNSLSNVLPIVERSLERVILKKEK